MSQYEYVLRNKRERGELVCVPAPYIFPMPPAEVIGTLQDLFLRSTAIYERYCLAIMWTIDGLRLQLCELEQDGSVGKILHECDFANDIGGAAHHDTFTDLLELLIDQYWSATDLGFYYEARRVVAPAPAAPVAFVAATPDDAEDDDLAAVIDGGAEAKKRRV